MRMIVVVVAALLMGGCAGGPAPRVENRVDAGAFDVVVYGGTPGGIMSSVAAARAGARVVLIEPTKHVGGMTTGGLSSTDIGKAETISGLAMEFFRRADAHYNDAKKSADARQRFMSEPHVAEKTFNAMLREAGVNVVLEQRLESLDMNGRRIARLRTHTGHSYAGRVFIDASYEGDVMAKAGVKYTVGRESEAQYGETLAGFRPAPLRPRSVEDMREDDKTVGGTSTLGYVHGTPVKIRARDEHGKLLWGVFESDQKAGDGDHRSQAYNFRVIMTRRKDNSIPFPKPANYDANRYAVLLKIIEAFPGVRFSKLVHFAPIPNGKFDVNASGLVMSTDHPGFNYGYPDGDHATRRRIYEDHVNYVQGLFWFLAHDQRVPADLREQVNQWGLAKDEFVDHGHWPYALYVREARRMQGRYVMRQQDCQREIAKSDAIAMGSFILDSHCVQRIVTPDGYITDEGNFDIPTRPYQIPYRAITPESEQCENLLVPVALSATHVAYGSIRMEPVFMMLGHAAGLAASMTLPTGAAVQEIDIKALQAKLTEQKIVLSLRGEGKAIEMSGLYMDDEDAKFEGHWTLGNSGASVGFGYRHDGDDNKGAKSATFTIAVPAEGRYEVRFSLAPFPNRAAAVPIRIRHADGEAQVTMDQRKVPPIDKALVPLGVYRFKPDQPAVVAVTTENTRGYVAVDAVQLVPVK